MHQLFYSNAFHFNSAISNPDYQHTNKKCCISIKSLCSIPIITSFIENNINYDISDTKNKTNAEVIVSGILQKKDDSIIDYHSQSYDQDRITFRNCSIELASILGTDASLLLCNFIYWINKNASIGRNIINNKVWTYQTVEAMSHQFFHISKRTIQNHIKKLKDSGILLVKKFNKAEGNHTNWYAIDEKRLHTLLSAVYRKERASIIIQSLGIASIKRTSFIAHSPINSDNANVASSLISHNTEKNQEKKVEFENFSLPQGISIQDAYEKVAHSDDANFASSYKYTKKNKEKEELALINSFGIDEDWKPNEKLIQKVITKYEIPECSLDKILNGFISYHKAKDSKYKNWDYAFEYWCNNARAKRKPKTINANNTVIIDRIFDSINTAKDLSPIEKTLHTQFLSKVGNENYFKSKFFNIKIKKYDNNNCIITSRYQNSPIDFYMYRECILETLKSINSGIQEVLYECN